MFDTHPLDEMTPDKLIDSILQDHCYKTYHRPNGESLSRPEEALAEKHHYTLMMGLIGLGKLDDLCGIPSRETALYIMAVLHHAQTYLWTSETWNSANELTTPKHVIASDVMSVPIQYWSPSGALGASDDKSQLWTDALCLSATATGVDVFVFASRLDDKLGRVPFIMGLQVPFGATWPDDFPIEQHIFVGQILSKLSFLNSPYIDSSPRPLSRHIRRASTRSGSVDPPLVSTVQLRSSTSSKNTGGSTENKSVYSVRWLVRGHHRAQWYPSSKSHRVIYIAPYVKGPEDKPLKSNRVYHVKR